MSRYIAIIDGAPRAGYGVTFPDLAGCVAMGDDIEDAIRNAGYVLSDWLDLTAARGQTMPTSRDLAQLWEDREVRADMLGAVAFAFIAPANARSDPSRVASSS